MFIKVYHTQWTVIVMSDHCHVWPEWPWIPGSQSFTCKAVMTVSYHTTWCKHGHWLWCQISQNICWIQFFSMSVQCKTDLKLKNRFSFEVVFCLSPMDSLGVACLYSSFCEYLDWDTVPKVYCRKHIIYVNVNILVLRSFLEYYLGYKVLH